MTLVQSAASLSLTWILVSLRVVLAPSAGFIDVSPWPLRASALRQSAVGVSWTRSERRIPRSAARRLADLPVVPVRVSHSSDAPTVSVGDRADDRGAGGDGAVERRVGI